MLPPSTLPRFREWLEKEIEARGWSIRQTARRANVSAARLSQILNGDRPGAEICIKLAATFRQSSAYVLYLAGYLERDPTRLIPADIEPVITGLESLRGTPLYEPVLRAFLEMLDVAMFKLDLPPE